MAFYLAVLALTLSTNKRHTTSKITHSVCNIAAAVGQKAQEKTGQNVLGVRDSRKRKNEELFEDYEELRRVALEHHQQVMINPRLSDTAKENHLMFTSELLAKHRKCTEIEQGSLHFWLTFSTLDSLEDLWAKSRSGYLTRAFKEEFVTQEFMKKFELKTISISATVEEKDYQNCKARLLDKGSV